MRFDAAPLEGVTDYPFREAHAVCFPGTDRYFSPFIAANRTCSLKTREKKETAPEHNSGVLLVPQILTNVPEAAAWAAGQMAERGYREVNINLGCPSASVVSHGKGAGQLADPGRLDAYFGQLFDLLGARGSLPVRVSVKTRIGLEEENAGELVRIYNRYPLSEVIVHPRLRTDFYKGKPDLKAFRIFYESCVHPVIYNGDIVDRESFRRIAEAFPDLPGVMIGRGLAANPALIRVLKGGEPVTGSEMKRFHDEVYGRRLSAYGHFGHISGKMKELWYYMGCLYPGADDALMRIRRSREQDEYERAAADLFSRFAPDPGAWFRS
ncbi:MAG: tRNA-dihydrouridine synthase family protein [Lachnospiraceae bacterium]|nr:tRNA-dihydrouridine synthase family protein [Lachnospiraceae bacterium]